MYKKVSSDMNFVDREKETVKFWKENEIFEKSIEERKVPPLNWPVPGGGMPGMTRTGRVP